MNAKEFLKSKGLKNPPLDSGISGGGDASRSYASDVMEKYANEIRRLYVNKLDCNGAKIAMGDTVKIDRYNKPLIGEVKQLDGGQFYIDHPEVCLKYKHQIHCEVCDTESPCFFLDFFDPYELEIIKN